MRYRCKGSSHFAQLFNSSCPHPLCACSALLVPPRAADQPSVAAAPRRVTLIRITDGRAVARGRGRVYLRPAGGQGVLLLLQLQLQPTAPHACCLTQRGACCRLAVTSKQVRPPAAPPLPPPRARCCSAAAEATCHCCADGLPAALKDSQGRFLKKLQVHGQAAWPTTCNQTWLTQQRLRTRARVCHTQAGERGDREVAFYAAMEQQRAAGGNSGDSPLQQLARWVPRSCECPGPVVLHKRRRGRSACCWRLLTAALLLADVC